MDDLTPEQIAYGSNESAMASWLESLARRVRNGEYKVEVNDDDNRIAKVYTVMERVYVSFTLIED